MESDVALRRLTPECAQQMLAWMEDSNIAEAIGLSKIPTLEGTGAWIQAAIGNPNICAWAVFWRAAHVGNVVFDQLDRRTGTARLSVYIGEAEARGRGVGTSALCQALSHAFTELNLYKVWLTVHVENVPAIRTYTRLGFQTEGTLRGAFLLRGRRVDALYMGLLAQEFLPLPVKQFALS